MTLGDALVLTAGACLIGGMHIGWWMRRWPPGAPRLRRERDEARDLAEYWWKRANPGRRLTDPPSKPLRGHRVAFHVADDAGGFDWPIRRDEQ